MCLSKPEAIIILVDGSIPRSTLFAAIQIHFINASPIELDNLIVHVLKENDILGWRRDFKGFCILPWILVKLIQLFLCRF